MKPKRFKPEFAVQAWVEEESRRFRPPDLDTLPIVEQGGDVGGEFTVQVASAFASDESKRKADIICLGIDDHAAIMSAWEGSVDDAHVVLSEGRFIIDTDEIVMPADATLSGKGWQTRLETNATSGTLIEMSGRNLVWNLEVQRSASAGNTLIGIELADLCQVFQVRGEQLQTFIGLPGGDDCYVGACHAHSCDEFLIASAGFERLLVTGNQEIGVIDLGSAAFYARVLGNLFIPGIDSMIQATGGAGVVVAQNQFISNSSWDIEVSGVTDWLITHNISSVGTEGISLTGDRSSVIANSMGNEGFLGGDGIVVVGDDNKILGNFVTMPGQNGANTFDGIRATGDRNHVQANTVIPHADTRYGINLVSGNDNAVYANYLGDASAYATDDFVDGGTGTMTAPGANGQFSF